MARMESWTGRPAPRNWSDHRKLKIVQEAATSDLGISEIAPRHDVISAELHLASCFRQNQRHLEEQPAAVAGPATLPKLISRISGREKGCLVLE